MQTPQDLTASATKAYQRLQELKLVFPFYVSAPVGNIFIKPVFIASYWRCTEVAES